MSFRYHGNYCGPGWSGGKYQNSISLAEGPPAVDDFDQSCRIHDDAYATNKNLKSADYRFFRSNIGRGTKRSLAALGVGAQGWLRSKKKNNMAAIRYSKRLKHSKGYSSTGYPSPARSSKRKKASTTGKKVSIGTQTAFGVAAGAVYKGSSGKHRYTKKKRRYRRKKRRGKHVNYRRDGSTLFQENGGLISDAQCVYVGCGTATRRLFESFFRAVYTLLLRKAGREIGSWEDNLIAQNGNLFGFTFTYYQPSVGSAAQQINYIMTTTAIPHKTMVSNIADEVQSVLGAGVRDLEFVSLSMASASDIVAIIRLDQLKLKFKTDVKLTVQNRTRGTGDNQFTDTVGANPIDGRVYKINSNRFSHKGKVVNKDSPLNWDTDVNTGVIAYGYGQTVGATNNDLIKPPLVSFWHGARGGRIMLQPGNSQSFFNSRVQTMSFDHAMNNLGEIIQTSDQNTSSYSKLGCAVMVAYEKVVDSRADVAIDEPNIAVAFQVENRISCGYIYSSMIESNVLKEVYTGTNPSS